MTDIAAWKKHLRQSAEALEDICALALSIETRAEDVLDQHPDKRLVKIAQDADHIRRLVAGIRAGMGRQRTLWEEESG